MEFNEDGKLIKLEGYFLPHILEGTTNQNIKVIKKIMTGENFSKAYNPSENKYPTQSWDIIIEVLNNDKTRKYKFNYTFEKYFNEWTPSDLYEDDIEEIMEI